MEPIVSAASELLSRGQGFVLATIVRCWGSAPRPLGTRMLITAEREIVGSIGGGLLEAQTIEAAIQMTDGSSTGRLLSVDLTSGDAASMGMICGGRVQILLDSIRPDGRNRALFQAWHETESRGHKASLVSVVSPLDDTGQTDIEHALVEGPHRQPGGDAYTSSSLCELPLEGRLALSEAALEALGASVEMAAQVQVLDLEGYLVVVHPGRVSPTLYIFGAGHVARPTAHVAAMVGFRVVVLDDRQEFADAAHFPDTAEVRTLSGFDRAFDDLVVNPDTYIVIVTRGHLHDREVLAQALKTDAVYIGMIGSRRKRDAIYESLLREGYTASDLERVHSPIGLTIGGDSPEEIAVSIVAELIAVRSGASSLP